MAPGNQRSIRLLLEAPVDRKEARRFGTEFTLSRLVLELPSPSGGSHSQFAALIESLRPPELFTFISPIGPFLSLKELGAQVNSHSVALYPEPARARTSSQSGTESVLRSWRSEVLAIFFADDRMAKEVLTSVETSESRWWQLIRPGYEGAYLKHVEVCDPIIFFSETRSALEFIGTEGEVRRAFEAIRDTVG